MGRGRAKAKQTKVARQLKYNSGRTDLSRLAEELGASPTPDPPSNGERVEDDDELEDNVYARYAEMYDEDDEEEDDGSSDASSSPKRRGA